MGLCLGSPCWHRPIAGRVKDTQGLQVGMFLFLAAGCFQLFIGVFTALVAFPQKIVCLSARTDQEMWGRPSQGLLRNRAVRDLRHHHVMVVAGLLCGVGALQALVAWFGVGRGEAWAVGALTVTGLLMVPWWFAMLIQFVRGGASVSVGDVQPFVWVHGVLWLGGSVFSWMGLGGVA
jgi:hypothetical protein